MALAALGGLLLVAALGAAWARLRGRASAAPVSLFSVIVQWLSAYILWTFAGGLALHFGLLARYDSGIFLLVALAAGLLQYRAHAHGGRERGLTVFVAAQLAWLVIVLARNGLLTP